jgi:hypothetical protein
MNVYEYVFFGIEISCVQLEILLKKLKVNDISTKFPKLKIKTLVGCENRYYLCITEADDYLCDQSTDCNLQFYITIPMLNNLEAIKIPNEYYQCLVLMKINKIDPSLLYGFGTGVLIN